MYMDAYLHMLPHRKTPARRSSKQCGKGELGRGCWLANLLAYWLEFGITICHTVCVWDCFFRLWAEANKWHMADLYTVVSINLAQLFFVIHCSMVSLQHIKNCILQWWTIHISYIRDACFCGCGCLSKALLYNTEQMWVGRWVYI